MCVMMLEAANWISYKDFSKWVFILIVWPENTNININTEYHVQLHK